MLKLSVLHNVPLRPLTISESAILRVTTNPDYPAPLRARHALLVDNTLAELPTGFSMLLTRADLDTEKLPPSNVLKIGPDLDYLSDGDVVRIGHDGRIRAIYRRAASA